MSIDENNILCRKAAMCDGLIKNIYSTFYNLHIICGKQRNKHLTCSENCGKYSVSQYGHFVMRSLSKRNGTTVQANKETK